MIPDILYFSYLGGKDHEDFTRNVARFSEVPDLRFLSSCLAVHKSKKDFISNKQKLLIKNCILISFQDVNKSFRKFESFLPAL